MGKRKRKAQKPTPEQKALISKAGFWPQDWLVLINATDTMVIVHRGTGERCEINK